jgi:hypothetical protein
VCTLRWHRQQQSLILTVRLHLASCSDRKPGWTPHQKAWFFQVQEGFVYSVMIENVSVPVPAAPAASHPSLKSLQPISPTSGYASELFSPLDRPKIVTAPLPGKILWLQVELVDLIGFDAPNLYVVYTVDTADEWREEEASGITHSTT